MNAKISQVGKKFIVKLDYPVTKIYGGRVYLSGLKPEIESDSKTFSVNVTDEPLDRYNKLIAILQDKLGYSIDIELSAKGTLQTAEKERQNFIVFSERARKIRNDECDEKEFTEFKNSLKSLYVQLKIFQLLSSYHLCFAQNACNFSVPGSGKTISVYAAYNYLKNLPDDDDKKIDRLLVVGPLSCFQSWEDDFELAFGRKPKYFEVYGGIPKKNVAKELNSTTNEYDFVLINYHSLNSYMDELINYMRLNRTMLVLDEAHKIKKIDNGLWSSTALKLSQYPHSRVILTGTPAPNGFEDIYNLYKFIWPSRNIIGYSPGQLAAMSKPQIYKRTEDLINRIEPFFIRITKKQLDLPEPIFENPIHIRMGKYQQIIYDALNERTPELEKDAKTNLSLFKSRLIRLRQAASNPSLLNSSLTDYYNNLEDDYVNKFALIDELDLREDIEDIIRQYDDNEVPAKFSKVLDMCNGIIKSGGKVIIWCEFVGNIVGLNKYLKDNGVDNELLYGGIENNARKDIIKRFHNNPNFRVIIANPHAVGESISLHKACHNAIYFEQSFDAATYMQSKDRIHRVGLDKYVETKYYFLHSIGTVDEVILERVKEKEKSMIGIVESRDIPLFTNNARLLRR